MNRRLDSWKAIAEYLGRDTATARRWEKTLGLPVRRVAGGAGRSVFAYTDDIDGWLAASNSTEAALPPAAAGPAADDPEPQVEVPETADPRVPPPAAAAGRAGFSRSAAAAVVLALMLLGTAWWSSSGRAAAGPLRILVDDRHISAVGERGREYWRYNFPANTQTAWSSFGASPRVIGGENPIVYVATSYRQHLPEGPVVGGELMTFDRSGQRLRTFSFDDEVAVRGTRFGVPWVITDFAVAEAEASHQVAVASHHYMWSPSLVTVLDANWRRQRTFLNDGWIESLKWAGPQRLIAGGFDEGHNGGLAVLLDTATMEPLRMVVMPRSEVNLVTASRFNRALIERVQDAFLARTVEMSADLSQGAIDAIYEFTPSLAFVRASYSGRYWEMHRSLEVQGKLSHSQTECPDRAGPREILVWEPSTGWRRQPIAR